MCYFCACCSSIIDLIQRTLTFCLTCILCWAVCLGIVIATVAGIAYGYNYSMAEFITFTRSDVTVFMRRGQFYDTPDISENFRRSLGSGDTEEDILTNRTTDYEEPARVDPGKPLADSWLKSQDTRKYAEKLTKYSPPKLVESPSRRTKIIDFIAEQSTQETLPNTVVPTVAWRDGTPEIVMRNFNPLDDTKTGTFGRRWSSRYVSPTSGAPVQALGFIGGKHQVKDREGPQEADEKDEERFMPVRSWIPTARNIVPDYAAEEVDEDNIVYKPI